MFTPEERDRLRDALLERARADERVTGAALTGSAALGSEDRWSDVDLFLGVTGDVDAVIADWTRIVYDEGAVTHWDVRAGAAVYRVFLLGSGLQVDVAFAPESDFAARGPSFHVLFGSPGSGSPSDPPAFADVAGLGWLGVLHAHKAIERGRPWEAAYWIGTIRDQALALACLRLGESPHYARGVDRLPPEVTNPLESTFPARLDPDELRRALREVRRSLVDEIRTVDASLADDLQAALPGG